MGIDWIDEVLAQTEHRPWPVPAGPWLMTMSWVDALAAHWPVDPSVLEDRIPPELTLETFEGEAWLTVLPFVMTDTAPRGLTWWPRPMRFLELNLRTYVSVDGTKPGIWFFSLDAESRLAVRGARTVFSLPYFDARMNRRAEHDRTVYQSERTHRGEPPAEFVAEYGPAGPLEVGGAEALDEWLMERYCLYSERAGRVFRVEVHHEPWPLRPAEADIRTNTLFESFELAVDGPPERLHCADRVDVLGWGPESVETPQ